jgi:hypothetical protein
MYSRLQVSAYLRTYETHALKEAVALSSSELRAGARARGEIGGAGGLVALV